jgi:hypothetical protein
VSITLVALANQVGGAQHTDALVLLSAEIVVGPMFHRLVDRSGVLLRDMRCKRCLRCDVEDFAPIPRLKPQA